METKNKTFQLKNDPLLKALVSLIKLIAALIRRHPYWTASIALHLCALSLIFSYGTYEYKQQQLSQEKGRIDESVQRVTRFQQKEIKRRVENIEKMKQLLDQSFSEEPEDATENTVDNHLTDGMQNKTLNISESNSPSDLLERAKALSSAIQKVSKEIQATDMARVLNMPKEEAMKKIDEKIAKEMQQKEQQTKKDSDNEKDDKNQDVAKVNDEIKHLEDEAKKVLEKRKQQLDAANNGFKIHPVNAATDPNQQSENTLSKTKSKTLTKGEGSGAGVGRASTDYAEPPSKRIDEFLSKDAPQGSWAFSESNISRIPTASEAERKTSGRSFGAGGEYAERVYLNRWYVIGPFAGNSELNLFNNPSYPPEYLVDLNAVYIGKDERILKWQYVSQANYPFVPPDTTTDAIYYGYSEIKFDQATDLWLWFGADDDLQVWMNEQLVWRGGNINKQALYDIAYNSGDRYWKTWNLTDGKRKVHFEQGINKVLFKLSNGPNPKGVFASIVLTKD